MKNLLCAAVILVSCNGLGHNTVPGSFTSRCGVTYRGSAESEVTPPESDEFANNELQVQENLALAFGLVKCEQLKGYSLYTHERGFQIYGDPTYFYRAGSTWCNELAPRVEAAINNPYVLLHEFHHVAQRCDAPYPVDADRDPTHANWSRSGAQERIDRGIRWLEITHWSLYNDTPNPYDLSEADQYAPTAADRSLAE